MARKIDPDKTEVTWVPDENCYRTVKRSVETVTVGGSEHAFEVAELGDKVQWVDDAPDDVENGEGHFATFTGEDEEYRPIVSNVAGPPAPNPEG